MINGLNYFAVRLGSYCMAITMFMSMLFPISTSVLCIASDHVAFEDINAGCCAAFTFSNCWSRIQDGLEGDCGNCTDIFVSTKWSEAISDSSDNALNKIVPEAVRKHPSLVASSYQFRLRLRSKLDTPGLISSSLQLRC